MRTSKTTLHFVLGLLFAFYSSAILAQESELLPSANETSSDYKCSVYTPWLSFSNFGKPETNTHHYELTLRYELNEKDRVGIKVATWKLFAPMGIPLWDPLFLDRSAFYPGRLQENGVGVTYQRMLTKKFFAAVEVLPLRTIYSDHDDVELGKGFKLYTSYHAGFHFTPLKNKRFFIEPQVHLNYWPVNTNVPESFKLMEDDWNNFFFVEPNLYLGFKF